MHGGIHLVGRPNSSLNSTAPEFIHLTHGDFFADIIRDRRDPNLWLYVVQCHASTAVLAMGSCTSEQMARSLAANVMGDLAASEPAATAAV